MVNKLCIWLIHVVHPSSLCNAYLKRPSNRSQRATARSLVGSSSQQLSLVNASSFLGVTDGDNAPLMDEEQLATSSRSASVTPKDGTSAQLQESYTKKGKGKAKAGDTEHHFVKEEPISLQLSEVATIQVSSQNTTLLYLLN